MVEKPYKKTHKVNNRPPFDCVALLLQGGGALGAYQAGVYEALAEAGLHPDWLAGISIGAINSAIIAGNPPETRVAKLREFWRQITVNDGVVHRLIPPFARGDWSRQMLNQLSAATAIVQGAAGFFNPRMPPAWLRPDGALEATSFYDTGLLKATLERFVDFDRINGGETRLSVGAVNVRSGNFVYFDTATHKIGPAHVMASGALPPGFPAVEIDGEYYWDGGLISNTPLQWVLDGTSRQDTLAFQVDLWNARGEFPRNLLEVETRRKEIIYSSRTRASTDRVRNARRTHRAIARLLDKLPEDLKNSPEAQALRPLADHKVHNIVHLIYRARSYEGYSKDYEFSRASMEEHWRAGYNDAVRTLRHPEILERPTGIEAVRTFDLGQDGRE